MAESKRQLLSIGIFFIIIVVGILLVATQVIKPWSLFFPVILILSGCWILVLAAIRSSKPQKYERGAFSTMGMGSLLVAFGGAWYLVTSGYFWYGLALILLVLGALAIAAALRRK